MCRSKEADSIRTNIVLDQGLVEEGMKLTGAKSMRELVNTALADLVAKKQRQRVLDLRGSVHWTGNVKTIRRGRFDSR